VIYCILKLVVHTAVLNLLMSKKTQKGFPLWSEAHELAFESVKKLVLSRECLIVIDHENPGNKKIFLTCDASEYDTGAVLSLGESWENAWPVAFDLAPLRGAELNYLVYEKELLAILRSLKKWCMDLLGFHVFIYTDHHTLLNFDLQRDMSRKSYAALRDSYYWPNMRRVKNLIFQVALLAKSLTTKAKGLLHPLPVPDGQGNTVAMDFIGPLPVNDGFDCILTITDTLRSNIRIIPTSATLIAQECAELFFTH
jgi:hypothetical protein